MVENIWGSFISDEDKSIVASGSSVKFGLNSKVFLTRFEYTTKTGKGGSEGNPAVIIEFDINGTNKNTRIYDITAEGAKIYSRTTGAEILDKKSEEYQKELSRKAAEIKGVFTHFLKASGKSEENIKAAYAKATDFKSLAQIVEAGMKETITKRVPLDLFMQYQYKIQGTADKTYPEIPTSVVFGAFVTPHMEGNWKEENEWVEEQDGVSLHKKGLRYVNEKNEVHRFVRTEAFFESKVSKQQTKDSAGASQANVFKPTSVTPETQSPEQTAW